MTNPYGPPGPGEDPHGQQAGYGQPAPGQVPYGQQPPPGYGPPSGGMPAPYGQPVHYGQPPYGAPGFGGQGGDINAIPDYKVWAIFSIFLGGVILGIFAIMKSNEVGMFKAQGQYAMAEQASRTTKTLCLISTILGGIGCIVAIILIIAAIVASTRYHHYVY